ncbi:hypothetical protein Tco_1393765 [Tanacetum coccineum]
MPFGRPYHTHPNRAHFTSDSSSSGSSLGFYSDTSSGSLQIQSSEFIYRFIRRMRYFSGGRSCLRIGQCGRHGWRVVDPFVLVVFLSHGGDVPDLRDKLEAGQLMASEERANLTDRIRSLGRENLRICRERDDTRRRSRRLESLRCEGLGFRISFGSTMGYIMTITRSGMTPKAIEELINQRVAEALATYEANRVGGIGC